MGACCSCQRIERFEGYHVEEEEEKGFEDDDIILRGDAGARVRLQGSSKYVSMFTQQGKKGVNQDAMTVWESFSGDKDMFFCAVFDGHGPSGHKVARYVRDFLPARISLSYKQASDDGKNAVLDIETEPETENSESKNPLFLSWKARMTKCFHEMDEQLEGDASIESYCSGTTSVCVLKKGEHLIIANLGDSRAVLCSRDESNQLVPEQLTVDLKPNLPGEAHRIRSCQGRVLAMDEEPNVYRIWMPHEDCPGLAMARAFGDFCLKDFGLISTPEVTYRKLTDRDEFVVLATDGIWDALSNDEVIKTIASARNRSTAAKLLIEKAVRAWRYKFPRAKIDDCAAICLFLKKQKPLLTKSVSEMSQLSLNYSELDECSCTGSARSDDALDTVLNCKVDESPENGETTTNRPRKRRPARKFEYVGE
ncbi:Serine/threonine protein phosphatase [Handroanthus impetiginosus]|uniref:Serine/threonine protein phosphatase n=1 Tax=Handroanthus impetiginosus TaxID=429701 RepID=A0A2G9G3A0_9LAMI|nr:Serine/threonine protein phosphatase [Handroanthus impetiginosus]